MCVNYTINYVNAYIYELCFSALIAACNAIDGLAWFIHHNSAFSCRPEWINFVDNNSLYFHAASGAVFDLVCQRPRVNKDLVQYLSQEPNHASVCS